jgi:hypothetical protein
VKEDKTKLEAKKDVNSKKHMLVLSMGSQQWRWAVAVVVVFFKGIPKKSLHSPKHNTKA